MIARLWGALLLALLPAVAPAQVVTLRADVWCPYNCQPNSPHPGYMIEIAERAFAHYGIRIEYRTLPWSRTLVDVRAGRIDGAVGATATDSAETRGLVWGQEVLGQSHHVFAVRAGRPPITNLADLATRSLVAIADYSYDDAIDAHIEAHRAMPERVMLLSGDDVTKRLIRLVLSGRVDALIETRAVLDWELRQIDVGEGLTLSGYGEPVPLTIAFTSADPRGQRYAAILDEGVRRMRASGEFGRILARYGVPDWVASN